uniref:Uncharacterized protein n=1 Tax=Physcomitrium patens TaxID=3218 RepID=A0A2K1II83_PHYPA|nr:hypothetical protein PHYPA_027684 [Physcomitrium patens]
MTTSLRSSRTRCGTTKTRGKAPCNNGRTIGMTTMSRMTSPCSSRRSSRRWTSECTVILKFPVLSDDATCKGKGRQELRDEEELQL